MKAACKRAMPFPTIIVLLVLALISAAIGIRFAIIGFIEMTKKSENWKTGWWIAMGFAAVACVLGGIAIYFANPLLTE